MSAAGRAPDSGRIARRFAALKAAKRGGLVTFVTAGDPDPESSLKLLAGLPAAGADLIEIGMPFSDPMADGPAIQASSLRALKAGMTLKKTLELVRKFRAGDGDTPIVLMGYYNPIYQYGVDRFLADFKAAGADGLIVVDLPPEEDEELCVPALKTGVNFIRLATPTTDDKRLPAVLRNTSGFVYYVSILGITGTRSAGDAEVKKAVERLKRHTDLPVAVGFGIKTPEQAAAVARVADAAVVGSALVSRIADRVRRRGRQRRRRGGARTRSAAGRRRARRTAHLGYSDPMNWLTNFVRPKLQALTRKPGSPDNLWEKCPKCEQMIFHRELEANLRVCPHCGHHFRVGWKRRLELLFDDGQYERAELSKSAVDPLKFRDLKRYTDRLKESQGKTGEGDAIVVASGRLGGQPLVIAAFNFEFMGGSMGMAVGDGLIKAARAGRGAEGGAAGHSGVRRRAHAGRHPLAHADAAHASSPSIW